jgi:N-acetylmuramoyl-L-alanine amidase
MNIMKFTLAFLSFLTMFSATLFSATDHPFTVAINPGHHATGPTGSLRNYSGEEPRSPNGTALKLRATTGTTFHRDATPIPAMNPEGTRNETDANFYIGKRMKERLETEGVNVIFIDPTYPNLVSNIERATAGNEADLSVSIHFMGAGSKGPFAMLLTPLSYTSTDGWITSEDRVRIDGHDAPPPCGRTWIERYKWIYDESMKMAGILEKWIISEYAGAVQPNNDGFIRYFTDITGLNWTTVPTMYVEGGYVGNPTEGPWIANHLDLIADTYVKAILEYAKTRTE